MKANNWKDFNTLLEVMEKEELIDVIKFLTRRKRSLQSDVFVLFSNVYRPTEKELTDLEMDIRQRGFEFSLSNRQRIAVFRFLRQLKSLKESSDRYQKFGFFVEAFKIDQMIFNEITRFWDDLSEITEVWDFLYPFRKTWKELFSNANQRDRFEIYTLIKENPEESPQIADLPFSITNFKNRYYKNEEYLYERTDAYLRVAIKQREDNERKVDLPSRDLCYDVGLLYKLNIRYMGLEGREKRAFVRKYSKYYPVGRAQAEEYIREGDLISATGLLRELSENVSINEQQLISDRLLTLYLRLQDNEQFSNELRFNLRNFKQKDRRNLYLLLNYTKPKEWNRQLKKMAEQETSKDLIRKFGTEKIIADINRLITDNLENMRLSKDLEAFLEIAYPEKLTKMYRKRLEVLLNKENDYGLKRENFFEIEELVEGLLKITGYEEINRKYLEKISKDHERIKEVVSRIELKN